VGNKKLRAQDEPSLRPSDFLSNCKGLLSFHY